MNNSVLMERVLPISVVLMVAITAGSALDGGAHESPDYPQRKAVIYVMPNALTGPEDGSSQVIAEGSHTGWEPQVAMIYHELQHSKDCQNFSETMVKEKADYFLLLQHGGGRGNRWAASDKDGNVIASGESFKLGTSVNDACHAISKHWQHQPQAESSKPLSGSETPE